MMMMMMMFVDRCHGSATIGPPIIMTGQAHGRVPPATPGSGVIIARWFQPDPGAESCHLWLAGWRETQSIPHVGKHPHMLCSIQIHDPEKKWKEPVSDGVTNFENTCRIDIMHKSTATYVVHGKNMSKAWQKPSPPSHHTSDLNTSWCWGSSISLVFSVQCQPGHCNGVTGSGGSAGPQRELRKAEICGGFLKEYY